MVFGVDFAQFEKNLATARIGAQTLPQELLRFGDLSQTTTQPIRRHGVGFHPLRVKISRNPQPRQYLPRLPRFVQVRMGGRKKMTSKAVDPIFRLP